MARKNLKIKKPKETLWAKKRKAKQMNLVLIIKIHWLFEKKILATKHKEKLQFDKQKGIIKNFSKDS